MKKTVIVFHNQKNLVFSLGDRDITLSADMPIKDAELIAAQYPGRYVAIEEEADPATKQEGKTK